MAPPGEWCTEKARLEHVLSFMETRHFLSLARMHGEAELAKRITGTMHFYIRLTNMVLGGT